MDTNQNLCRCCFCPNHRGITTSQTICPCIVKCQVCGEFYLKRQSNTNHVKTEADEKYDTEEEEEMIDWSQITERNTKLDKIDQ